MTMRRFEVKISVELSSENVDVQVAVNGDDPSSVEVLGAIELAKHTHMQSKLKTVEMPTFGSFERPRSHFYGICGLIGICPECPA